MWKHFVFGLIVGAIGSVFIFMKSRPTPLIVVVEAGGDTTSLNPLEDDMESLVKSTLFEDEFEMMLWLMSYSTYLQTVSEAARWN